MEDKSIWFNSQLSYWRTLWPWSSHFFLCTIPLVNVSILIKPRKKQSALGMPEEKRKRQKKGRLAALQKARLRFSLNSAASLNNLVTLSVSVRDCKCMMKHIQWSACQVLWQRMEKGEGSCGGHGNLKKQYRCSGFQAGCKSWASPPGIHPLSLFAQVKWGK